MLTVSETASIFVLSLVKVIAVQVQSLTKIVSIKKCRKRKNISWTMIWWKSAMCIDISLPMKRTATRKAHAPWKAIVQHQLPVFKKRPLFKKCPLSNNPAVSKRCPVWYVRSESLKKCSDSSMRRVVVSLYRPVLLEWRPLLEKRPLSDK